MSSDMLYYDNSYTLRFDAERVNWSMMKKHPWHLTPEDPVVRNYQTSWVSWPWDVNGYTPWTRTSVYYTIIMPTWYTKKYKT